MPKVQRDNVPNLSGERTESPPPYTALIGIGVYRCFDCVRKLVGFRIFYFRGYAVSSPHSIEEKSKEYNLCPNGIIGIETMLPIIYTYFVKTGMASLNDMVDWLVTNPNKVFGLEEKKIEIGYPADITILDINNKKVYTKDEILSIGKNAPYIGMEFYGFPKFTLVNGKVVYKA